MSPVIVDLSARPTDIPMRELFQTARSQTSVASNVTVTLTLEDGTQGYGGATAMSYVTGESRETILTVIPQMRSSLIGEDARNYRKLGLLLENERGSLMARLRIQRISAILLLLFLIIPTSIYASEEANSDTAARIDTLLDNNSLKHAFVGVLVQSLKDGRIIYSKKQHTTLYACL